MNDAYSARIFRFGVYVLSGSVFRAVGVIFKERLSVSGLYAVGVENGERARDFVRHCRRFGMRAVESAGKVRRLRPRRFTWAAERRLRSPATKTCASPRRLAVNREDSISSARVPRRSVKLSRSTAGSGRSDPRIEKIVTKLGSEPGVFAVSWKAAPTSDDERELVTEA